MHIITNHSQCPIKPSDIDVNNHFTEAFGNFETEISAKLIVKQCQVMDVWHPLEKQTLDKRDSSGTFHWNRLLDSGYVVEGEDGFFRVTIEFVARCYGASPKIRTPVRA